MARKARARVCDALPAANETWRLSSKEVVESSVAILADSLRSNTFGSELECTTAPEVVLIAFHNSGKVSLPHLLQAAMPARSVFAPCSLLLSALDPSHHGIYGSC